MSFESNAYQGTDAPEEVLKAGALYREYDIVNLRIPSPTMTEASDAQLGKSVYLVGDDVDDDVDTHRPQTWCIRQSPQHISIELWRANSTELARKSENMMNCKCATTALVPSFPRWATRSLIRLALTEFLDNIHTIQTLQTCIQHFSQGCHSQTPATYSGPTHPHPSSLTLPTHTDFVVVGSGIIRTPVVMLKARDACSGATGSVITDSQVVAQKMIKLRFARLEELRSVVEQEGILAESHWREVDVFYNSHMFEKAAGPCV
ncbi:hypothetical protein DFJ58DRAFT_730235 [Suillus subalutaceus]|uniref:uncharacterized protein n=1 Tax=Suillus subalutaceus TaxID=48586 RepID=UPI001B85EA09|nr:uncharacterized protein DFJ58DRAFT_730235 [Suillus subalutaceus]KAG1847353.1 hypothetical protein DFJ58DRAFT_730235 [Suillus subalutaceus]